MKEEALKLAEQLEDDAKYGECDWTSPKVSADMIRRLVEELDRLDYDLKSLAKRYKALNRTKPLSDEEIKAIENSVKYSELALSNDEYMLKFARAIEERHGIK